MTRIKKEPNRYWSKEEKFNRYRKTSIWKYEVKNREWTIKKRIPSERKWFSCSIQEIKQKEFEIVKLLSKDFSIKSLCEVMNISRSGYYKWLKTKDILNRYEINRKDLEPLIRNIHKRKPSYGYHRINTIIRRETGWIVSDNLVHKVCKILKKEVKQGTILLIKSQVKNQLSVQILLIIIGILQDN